MNPIIIALLIFTSLVIYITLAARVPVGAATDLTRHAVVCRNLRRLFGRIG